MNFKYVSPILFLTILQVVSYAQSVIDIEDQRIITDTTGWSGSAAAEFVMNKYLSRTLDLSCKSHLQFKTNKTLYLLLADYKFLEAGQERFINAGFVHFRYNVKINKGIRWELFSQLQTNKILKVNKRFLIGTGPRFKIVSVPAFALYYGLLYMYEWENLIEPSAIHRDHRISAYLSTTIKAGEVLKIQSTLYFQPLLRNVYDHRLANTTKFIVSLSKHFFFTTSVEYFHDTAPPIGIPKDVYSMSNGIGLKF